MAKKPTYHRTTITVPSDLKRRMDAAGNAVNWSAVAARAFERELAEIASKENRSEMGDLIQKLRAAKARVEDEAVGRGRKAGRQWVHGMATDPSMAELVIRCLERLEQFHQRFGSDWEACFAADDRDAYGSDERLYFVLHPEDDGDRNRAYGFWLSVLGREESPEASFVQGFAEGALALWDEVKDRL